MRRRKLLDLFCGGGGCSVGYHRAGFTEIVGVDIAPQKHFPYRFCQVGALEFLSHVRPGDYDCIHASPPCQSYSRMRHLPWLAGRTWPMLIEPLRAALRELGTPYVIENVEGAPLEDPVRLCGTMFGLGVYRHRLFECWPEQPLLVPSHSPHRIRRRENPHTNTWDDWKKSSWCAASLPRVNAPPAQPTAPWQEFGLPRMTRDYSAETRGNLGASRMIDTQHVGRTPATRGCRRWVDGGRGHQTSAKLVAAAMGIDWPCTRDELCQMIPPKYCEWLGREMLRLIG